jgi:putative ABC transport system permease protein
MVVIPVASAQMLFNSQGLFRVMVEATSREAIPKVKEVILATIRLRHDGEDDVTVITQDALLATFDRIFTALTLTVGGIGATSLLVAGILVMNVMLVAVSARTAEIGLLKALGAPRRSILALFLTEAALLSGIGACIGLALGEAMVRFIGWLYPVLPVTAPWWAILAGVGTALGAGLVFGVLPARRAARLDPVAALARR